MKNEKKFLFNIFYRSEIGSHLSWIEVDGQKEEKTQDVKMKIKIKIGLKPFKPNLKGTVKEKLMEV